MIELRGEIASGDAALVAQAVKASPYAVELLILDSPGGDPFEALKISDILNSYFIEVSTGTCRTDEGDCPDREKGRCASACALLFMTANARMGTEVYLHRPTLPAGFFASLSGPEAEKAYDTALRRLLTALQQRGVPDALQQQMMSIPSDTLQKLTIGYPTHSPWMDEWLLAKCGIDDGGVTSSYINCETDVILGEQVQVQRKNPAR